MKHIVIAILFISLGCSTTKKLGPVPERSKEEVTRALKNRNIDFEWFSGKMSTSLESPDENVSGSMVVRMKKDSVLWVVVKKFGFEAARLLVDKDTYTILYRLESAYESGSISQINDIISVSADFTDLQQLLFGNVILPENDNILFKKDSLYYVIQTKVDGILLDYYVNGYNLQLEKMHITDKMNRVAIATYNDYRKIEGFGSLPFERTFVFPYSADQSASIQMRFSEIEINVPREVKFSIPDRYEKIN